MRRKNGRQWFKEGKTRNLNNWNELSDELKETHSEEQDSNEIDYLL